MDMKGLVALLRINNRRKRIIAGVLFTLPWFVGLSLFYFYPIVMSFYYSFTKYSILKAPEFIGGQNYVKIVNDPIFWTSLYNSTYYATLAVPVGLIFGLSLALGLNQKVRGIYLYRTLFYLPVLVPQVCLTFIWMWMLNSRYGLINNFLALFNITGPGWLTSKTWSKLSVVAMAQWGVGQAVIIFLAGLQDVPQQLYEAADIDGAKMWHKIRHITIPILTPIIFLEVITGLIGGLQMFTIPYVLTRGTGAPANSLMFYIMYLFRHAFVYMNMGYACTMAWLFFVIAMVLILFIIKSSKWWVHYERI